MRHEKAHNLLLLALEMQAARGGLPSGTLHGGNRWRGRG
jgi:hypothetical protein